MRAVASLAKGAGRTAARRVWGRFESRARAGGFVVSFEFLLVVALVVVPLIIGGVLLSRKLMTLALTKRSQALVEQPFQWGVVWDSTNVGPTPPPKVIGPVMGYDPFEAPLVVFRDSFNDLGVLLGVRRLRFTSYSRVYYSNLDCTGTPYLRSAASQHGEVGVLYQLQGTNYAVGNGNILYREGQTPPPYAAFQSLWISQDIADGSPAGTASTACQNVTTDPGDFIFEGILSLTCVAGVSPAPATITVTVTGTIPAGATTAELTYSGNNPNALEYISTAAGLVENPPGTYRITVTVVPTSTFTYNLTTSACPSGTFPPGQLQFVTVSGDVAGGGASAADFHLAVTVIDLDAAGRFASPFRLSFPTPAAGPGLQCPDGECGAPIPTGPPEGGP